MTDRDGGSPTDSVTIEIAAPAERVYALVSDIGGMGRLSPECTGGRWLGGATGPSVGARFRGSNRRGLIRWWTTNRVVAADLPTEFAFVTRESGIRWGFHIEPIPTGVRVTQTRTEVRDRPFLARLFATVALGGVDAHDEEVREGMRTTLARLKELAEWEGPVTGR